MTKQFSDQLKGIAILMVVLIHVLAQLPEAWWYVDDQRSHIMLALDQISRISVPLFLFSSWYGLGKKFEGKSVTVWEFLKSRVFKLLPLYILWSVGLMVAFRVVGSWQEFMPDVNLWQRFLFGQADYHLYFVPLLVMLYVGFLAANRLSAKAVMLLSPLVIIAQWWWFAFFETHSAALSLSFLPADQAKYIWPLSWMWYLWLGLLLAKSKQIVSISAKPLMIVATGMAMLFFAQQMIDQATSIVAQGYNVLPTTQFTRPAVVWYVTAALLFLVGWGQRHSLPGNTIWEWFGRNSYLVYLSHTLLLRLTVAHLYDNPLNVSEWLLGAGILAVLLFISNLLNKRTLST